MVCVSYKHFDNLLYDKRLVDRVSSVVCSTVIFGEGKTLSE